MSRVDAGWMPSVAAGAIRARATGELLGVADVGEAAGIARAAADLLTAAAHQWER